MRALFLIFLFAVNIGYAQSVSTLLSARACGMGYASATIRDEWSLFNNTGGLSKIDKLNIAFAYDINPGLIGANRTGAVLSSPLKTGAIGLGLFRFGDDLYSEQLVTLGYSNQFGNTSLGLKLNYIQYRSDAFGVRNALSINFGGITEISPRLLVGAYIVNLNQSRLSTLDKERLPAKFVAGIGFRPIDIIFLAIEIEKDLGYNAMLKGGIEYQIHKKVYARTGFNLYPSAGFLGMGFNVRKLKIDYALQYTTMLNAAHQASVTYRVEKKQKKS